LTAIGNQSLQGAEVSLLKAVLKVIDRVIELSISIVVVVSAVVVVIDIHNAGVPTPIATVVAHVDVVAVKVARKERV
jgi:hypothetical protein